MKTTLLFLLFCAMTLTAYSQTAIQAEDAFLSSAYVRQTYSGYTGTGYVDVVDKTGAYLEFVFRRTSAASDTVTMYYANGGSNRNFAITVNDVSSGTVTLTATGGWTTWSSKSVVLSLAAGTNRVRFTTTTNGGYPNVDRIVIGGQAAVTMYKLTLTKSGSGSVSASPSATYYDAGSSVELTATASGNSFFKRWMGGNDSPASTYNLVMNGHKTVVGVFLDTTGTAGFVYQATADAFAGVNAYGYNGTTGGAGGDEVIVTTGDELWTLLLLRQDASRTVNHAPLTVYIAGILSKGSLFGSNKMMDLKDAYDISLIGIGNDATITGFGIQIVRSSNIIFRNIKFASCPDDGVSIQGDDAVGTGHHIWVDHCTFQDTPPAGYPASGTYDGAFDITHGAEYVTASWNHFIKHDKNCLMGHSDNQSSDVILKVSYHHNYFDSTVQRNPRVRYGKAHVFNNYYRKNGLYGVSSNLEADVLVEGNYFEQATISTETSRDGSPPGDVVERNNVFVSSGVPGTRGTAFEASGYYSYSLDSASAIPAMLEKYAGSGIYDFSYTGSVQSYTLTTNAENGTVTKDPDQPTYNTGTSVQLTATPSMSYYFVNWTGDVVPSQANTNPMTITMDGNKTITANFTNQTHTLTVNATNGSVAKSPDLANYPQGSSVQLTATPSGGYFFISWSGDVPAGHESDNPLTLTMDANKTLTANFSSQTFSLTVNATNGTVTRDPNQAAYDSGSVVQLTPVPATGYHFVNWSGDASGSANPLSLTMNANKTITANFAINTYTLGITSSNGTVTKNPDQATYDYGTSVTLTATPNTGYSFSSWSGDASGTSNQVTIVMNANKSVTANYQSLGSIILSNGTGGGDWNSASTWQGGSIPNGTHTVFIQGTDSVFNASAVSCTSLTIKSGGKLSTTAAITVSTVFAIEANGWYYHSVSGTVTMPGATKSFDDASTVVYNYASGSVSFSGGTFGNLIISRNANTNLTGALTVNGNLTVSGGTGSSGLRGSSASTSRTNTVHGNLYVLGGTISCIDNPSGGAVAIWNIGGDVFVNGTAGSARLSPFSSGGASGALGIYNIGGNLSVSGGRIQTASNGTTLSTGIINLQGNLTINSGSSITDNASTNPFALNFTGSDTQYVTLGMNFAMATHIYDTVKTGSTVVFDNGSYTWGSTSGTQGVFVVNGSLQLKGASAITGTGAFTLNPGATLALGSADGLSASGATGNIQVSGSRTFSTEASYAYIGDTAQVTGNGLPATVEGLAINNNAGVTLSSSVTVNNELAVLAGDLDLNGNTVTLGSTAALSETPGNTVKGTSGAVTTTRILNAPELTTDIAGLGVSIGSSANLGSTVITRGHAEQANVDSGSIARYFEITPTNNAGLSATMKFRYDDSELNGKPEATLGLFKSTDGGTVWTKQGGAVNSTNNTITLSGINDFSRWTASTAEESGEPAFSVAPASLNFGNVIVNATGNDSVTVSNTGTLALAIDSVRVYGGEFTAMPGGSAIVSPSGEKVYAVTFHPTASGTQSAVAIFYHNAISSPDTVTLNGTGYIPTVMFDFAIQNSWNLLSIPLAVPDASKAVLFPTAVGDAFKYLPSSGYVSDNNLQNAVGYWLKFSSDQTVSIEGEERGVDTVHVQQGWNIIGTLSSPVAVSAIVPSQPGLVQSSFFAFNNGYASADTLQPGKGYWVKAGANGTLILSSPVSLMGKQGKSGK